MIKVGYTFCPERQCGWFNFGWKDYDKQPCPNCRGTNLQKKMGHIKASDIIVRIIHRDGYDVVQKIFSEN